MELQPMTPGTVARPSSRLAFLSGLVPTSWHCILWFKYFIFLANQKYQLLRGWVCLFIVSLFWQPKLSVVFNCNHYLQHSPWPKGPWGCGCALRAQGGCGDFSHCWEISRLASHVTWAMFCRQSTVQAERITILTGRRKVPRATCSLQSIIRGLNYGTFSPWNWIKPKLSAELQRRGEMAMAGQDAESSAFGSDNRDIS